MTTIYNSNRGEMYTCEPSHGSHFKSYDEMKPYLTIDWLTDERFNSLDKIKFCLQEIDDEMKRQKKTDYGFYLHCRKNDTDFATWIDEAVQNGLYAEWDELDFKSGKDTLSHYTVPELLFCMAQEYRDEEVYIRRILDFYCSYLDMQYQALGSWGSDWWEAIIIRTSLKKDEWWENMHHNLHNIIEGEVYVIKEYHTCSMCEAKHFHKNIGFDSNLLDEDELLKYVNTYYPLTNK